MGEWREGADSEVVAPYAPHWTPRDAWLIVVAAAVIGMPAAMVMPRLVRVAGVAAAIWGTAAAFAAANGGNREVAVPLLALATVSAMATLQAGRWTGRMTQVPLRQLPPRRVAVPRRRARSGSPTPS